MSVDETRLVWRRLLRAFGPNVWAHRYLLCGAYISRLIAVGAAILAPWPLKVIIDNIIPSRPISSRLMHSGFSLSPERLVIVMVLLFLCTTVIGAITNALEKNLSAKVREKLTLQLRDRLLGH